MTDKTSDAPTPRKPKTAIRRLYTCGPPFAALAAMAPTRRKNCHCAYASQLPQLPGSAVCRADSSSKPHQSRLESPLVPRVASWVLLRWRQIRAQM
jgi:hypothetical protein